MKYPSCPNVLPSSVNIKLKIYDGKLFWQYGLGVWFWLWLDFYDYILGACYLGHFGFGAQRIRARLRT